MMRKWLSDETALLRFQQQDALRKWDSLGASNFFFYSSSSSPHYSVTSSLYSLCSCLCLELCPLLSFRLVDHAAQEEQQKAQIAAQLQADVQGGLPSGEFAVFEYGSSSPWNRV